MTTVELATMTEFQRLHYVQIAPKGTLVPITGCNGVGKSSLMDGIVATLLGQNKRDFPKPVHEGADQATTELTLSNGMKARRKFNPDASSTLTAKSADGKNVAQGTINGMISAIGMDTGAFADLDDKKQLEALMKMVVLPFVPAELEAERKRVFDARTAHNNRVKDLTAQIGRFLDIPEGLPEEETLVAALAEQIRTAENAVRSQQADIQGLEQHGLRLAEIDRQIADLQRQRQVAMEDSTSLRAVIDSHQAVPEVEDLRLRMSTAEDTNAMIRVAKEKAGLEVDLLLATGEADRATVKLEQIAKQKADGLANTKFPAEGMSFDEEGVLLNGRPLRKASTGEYAEAMVDMIIASDPELKVIIVRNGNDLDSARLARIEAKGEAAGFQIFAEFVDETGEFGWTITDGKLAA